MKGVIKEAGSGKHSNWIFKKLKDQAIYSGAHL